MLHSAAETQQSSFALGLALVLGLLVTAATAIYATADTMETAVTPDLPWILGAGAHIIAARDLPTTDLFSWTHGDVDWVLYQWLFEVVMAAGQATLGLATMAKLLVLVMALIYLFAPLFFGLSKRVPVLVLLLPACAAFAISTYNISLRPMVVSALFMLIQYVAIDRLSRGKSSLWNTAVVLGLVYMLWGNMHMAVFLGLLSLVLCLAGDLLQVRGVYHFTPPLKDVEGKTIAVRTYVLLISVAFLASLCNPYGLGIYTYLLNLSSDGRLNQAIIELQSLNFHFKRPAMFLVLASIFFLSLMRAPRIYNGRELLHLFVFTLWTFVVARFIIWGVLFYALILPKAIYQLWATCEGQEGLVMDMVRSVERHRRRFLAALAGICLAAVLLVPLYLRPFSLGVCNELEPGIMAYLQDQRPQDKLFNDYLIGSCALIYAPQQKVFYDTRFDFYPTDFVMETQGALNLVGDWRAFLDRWGITLVLIGNNWPLAGTLRAAPGFRVVFEDERSILFRRDPIGVRNPG